MGPVGHAAIVGRAGFVDGLGPHQYGAHGDHRGRHGAGAVFSGLTPGFVGLYQVNVAVPSDAPTGTQPLKLSIGGQDVTVNVVVQ